MEKDVQTEKLNKAESSDRVLVYLVSILLLGFVIAFIAADKKSFSENENRYLAKVPEFSWENIKSGAFTSGIENYFADHFPMRDAFLSFMTEAERLSGRKEINGVYIARDGSLIEVYDVPKNTEKQIRQFSKLAENVSDARCMLMLVPTAVEVYSERLPENSGYDHKQKQVIEHIYDSVNEDLLTIDAVDLLDKAGDGMPDERLFYRTDHHWTMPGAYEGYRAFCREAGITQIPLSDYKRSVVSLDFKGTIYSKLNDPYFGSDEIISFEHPDWKLEIEYSDTSELTDTPYNSEYLKQKDQYSYFLNNIHPLITITNNDVDSGALAIVKDSYANSMIPFLIENYHTIYVFDTRYYKGGPSKFINEHEDISDVLILYNMNTIDNDTGIGGIY
ncbi:MAG: hypothetical protein K6E91_12980 [Butyrivibrio sp.]|nr:hypothetical protein [Butyrivibrio sp.]